jgi:hypothetical protein
MLILIQVKNQTLNNNTITLPWWLQGTNSKICLDYRQRNTLCGTGRYIYRMGGEKVLQR